MKFELSKFVEPLTKLVKVSKPTKDILLFTYDGYALSGALVHFKSGQPRVLATGLSTNMNMQKSIADILSEIQRQGFKKLPKKTYLASAEVVFGRVDIPVSSKKPKQNAQMHELVRWELESYTSVLSSIWSVGTLLEGYGLITPEQRLNASVELELARDQGSSMVRFGEICIQLEYITREQFNEILSLQEHFISIEGHLDCSWQSQVIGSEEQDLEDVWIGVGIFHYARKKWGDAFFRNSLHLETITSLHGLAGLFVDDSMREGEDQVLIEVFKERVVIYRFIGSVVVSIGHFGINHKDDILNTVITGVSEQVRPETEAIWVSSIYEDVFELSEALSLKFEKEVKWIQEIVGHGDVPLNVPSALLYQYMALAKLVRSEKSLYHLLIEAQDPKPPLWKNPNFWRYLAPFVVLISIGLNEIYMQYSLSQSENKLQEIEAEKVEKERVAKQMSALNAQTNKEKEQLEQIDKQVDSLEAVVNQMNAMIKRNPLITEILLAFQDSINDLVLIDRFTELDERDSLRGSGFEVQGWSLNENDAQIFSEELGRNVEKLGYAVQRVKINRSIGRSGIRGYGFSFSLIKQKI